jgi:hypothetical protein
MNMAKDYILRIMRSNNTVFTFKDIALIWGETNADLAKKRIYRYVKAGKLYAIRRGIYAKDTNYDKFELATKIFTPSYISMETVLAKEGVIFQHYSQIFAVSYLTRELFCDGQTYVFRKIKDSVLANPFGIEKKGNFSIATKERAFLDMLYLSKEYHFDNLTLIDWEKCFQMLEMYENKAMAKRLNSYRKDAES